MASKRRLRRNACDGKRKFDTSKDASENLKTFAWKLLRPMQVYKCKFCTKYHYGHSKYSKINFDKIK